MAAFNAFNSPRETAFMYDGSAPDPVIRPTEVRVACTASNKTAAVVGLDWRDNFMLQIAYDLQHQPQQQQPSVAAAPVAAAANAGRPTTPVNPTALAAPPPVLRAAAVPAPFPASGTARPEGRRLTFGNPP